MYKILIIEDDNTISEQVSKYLGRWGYETACAADFGNILPQFIAFGPQLVLLDIDCPFITDIIGAVRSVKFHRFRWYLFLRHPIT